MVVLKEHQQGRIDSSQSFPYQNYGICSMIDVRACLQRLVVGVGPTEASVNGDQCGHGAKTGC